MLKVLKFGGTSVGTLDRIQNVAQIIKKIKDEGHDVIAIVSAMSGETNKLIEYAETYTKVPVAHEMDMLLSSGESDICSFIDCFKCHRIPCYFNEWTRSWHCNGCVIYESTNSIH